MKQFIKWSFSVILVVVSVLVVVYLPEYIALQKDKEYVNQYQLYEQDTSDITYMDLEFTEKMEILLLPDKMEGDTVCVIQTKEPEVVLESNESLFTNLTEELASLEQLNLIPIVSADFDLQKDLEGAELNALTSDRYPGKVLYVWKLTFVNEEGVAYTVTMDANTYKIYDLYVSGYVVRDYLDVYNQQMDMVGGAFYEMHWNWFTNYANYLNYVDENMVQESMTEVLELKWSQTGVFGQMQTSDIPWNLHLYVNVEEQLFHFRMSNVYEYDKASESYAY